ncbi:polymeric immunoglobulin receptor-like protein [Labeo rohita]|nr:polymeric immunoglobulin receptor-like protein [Labeo rohita]
MARSPILFGVLLYTAAPDVSVVSSSVSGHKGGDISVQCLYSSEYKNKPKRWCRFEDQSCYTVGRTYTSQNSSVQIHDDGTRNFTLLMTGLRLTDSGWYFCSVRDLQVPVQLHVWRDNDYKNGALSKRGPDVCSVAESPMSITYDTVVFKKTEDHEKKQVCIAVKDIV